MRLSARLRLVALMSAAAIAAAPLAAQTDDGTTFRWSGRVVEGRFIRLYNMNGDIRVERGAPGSPVEVVAERRVDKGDAKLVRFDLRLRDDGDVVICALWGLDMTCTDGGSRGSYSSRASWRNDRTNVTIRVRVPDGVKAFARSTNGSIAMDGLTSEIDAATTNGNVSVRTSGGLINATTTNGSVTATLGDVAGDQPMRFATTNGSVTVYAPPSLSADLEMTTTNGGVVSDFPLTINGSIRRNQLRATLGAGGRTIVVRSTNGNVALKRNVI